MARINIKNVAPGMVLSEDAVHANGRVLLKAGSELTENYIKVFKTWGVVNVEIKSDDNHPITAKKQYAPDEIKRAINRKRIFFQHCDLNHPFMNELFRMSVKMSLDKKLSKLDELDS